MAPLDLRDTYLHVSIQRLSHRLSIAVGGANGAIHYCTAFRPLFSLEELQVFSSNFVAF